MNCIEVRRKLLEDPVNLDESALAHIRECPSCAQAWHKALAFESDLRESLVVEPPDGLGARILLLKDMKERRQFRFRPPPWLARAAGFALMFIVAGGLGYLVGDQPAYAQDLPRAVMEHVQKEPEAFQSVTEVPVARVEGLFSRFGGLLTGSIGVVLFVEPCWIRRQTGLHLVVQSDSGPVTVIYMPGEYVKKRQQWESGDYSGVILPLGSGSLAVIATDPGRVESMLDQISKSVMWPA